MLRIFLQHFARCAHKPTASYFFSHAHNANCCFSTSCAALVKPGACATPPDYGPSEMGRCTLNNGIKLVSAKPFGAEMAACTILFQGGSRFEYDDQLGVTHFLRRCSSASGCAYSTFSKTRVLQQLGSYITVNADRQSIAYTLRCPAPAFHDVKYYLLDIAARASFKQHDVDARKDQIKLDLQTVRPEALTIDLVQKALWGGGLSNSIFCEEARIDSMSAAHMEAFTSLNLRSDGCTVGSYGLAFEDLMKFAEMIEPSRAAPLRPQCYPPSFVRGGFEYHDLGPGSDTCIAVAVPGCGNLDLCQLMKHSIIAAAAGTGSSARGQHHEDHVAHAPLSKCAPDVHTQVKAFNLSYAETGVFELDLSMNDDDCVSVTEGLALQAACDVRLDNAACSIAMLDTISDQEILTVAKCLSCSCNKMAVAVVGDVEAVPHDRELLYC